MVLGSTRALIAAEPAPGMTRCTMVFSLKGWSAFYKTANGQGQITCSNGESAVATLKVSGGGLTFGKDEILKGHGSFSEVRGVDEAFGTYVAGEVHAGVVKSAQAAVYSKGEISLALAGTGRGINLGVDFGKLTISRPRP
jgi:hypothetical protein